MFAVNKKEKQDISIHVHCVQHQTASEGVSRVFVPSAENQLNPFGFSSLLRRFYKLLGTKSQNKS